MEEKALLAVVTAADQMFFGLKKKKFIGLTTFKPYPKESDSDVVNISAAALSSTFLKEKVARVPRSYNLWILNYTEAEFFAHFRMTRSTFNALLKEIVPLYERHRYHGGLQATETKKALLIVLWYLAKGATYISTADRFAVGISTVHLIVTRMLEIINDLRNYFIRWPTKDEAPILEKKFRDICGFPGTIAAIDGSHIMCKVREDQHDSYQNRKCQHSIIMQGICSADRLITNIFVGFPGRANDARVLQQSPFFQQIEEEGHKILFNDDYHLIGDKAYPLQEWLMTPYKDNGRLTRREKNYNISLSRTRVVIEHVFGMLKGRWRILMYVNAYSIEKIVKISVACAVLHNICLINDDVFDELFNEESISINQGDEENNFVISGTQKRELICSFLEN